MAILHDDNSISVYRGQTRKKTIYIDKDSVLRLSVFWDKYIPSGNTITSTWDTEPSGDNTVSIASAATSGSGVECYITPIDSYDVSAKVKNTIVTSGGETASVIFKIIVTET